ncbi:MAG: 6-phosphogluconolactonase [Thermoguttaceae bacterium]|nr:6-phosphogluconolactonase [Thermoguttaceae bacterium]
MRIESVRDYKAMSSVGASILFDAAMAKISKGMPFNLGLATGNTMVTLYEELAAKFNIAKADLSLLRTWNLDEYAATEHTAVPHDHPLSYWKYMHENLFRRFDPQLGFKEENAHFPNPAKPDEIDTALVAAGGIDLQLLGIGFNGHIAFNEPMSPDDITVEDFGNLPTRVLPLTEATIEQNTRLTAGGERSLMPRFAATLGMRPILNAKQCLLLACFPEQESQLNKMIGGKRATPALPASYLLTHSDSRIIYTADCINLGEVL